MEDSFGVLNRLIPFATPGTPLWQDLVHLTAVCGALYFAPQIQEWHRNRQATSEAQRPQHSEEADIQPEQEGEGENHGTDEQGTQDEQQLRQAEQQPGLNDNAGAGDRQGDDADAPPQPGLAAEPRDPPAQHSVGAKKAKSLARRNQRRAYHEFQRSQGEAQRARDVEGAQEREAALLAERERRRAAEAKLQEKNAKDREARREQERREREEDARRRGMVVKLVREGLEESRTVDLWRVAKQIGGDVDEEWVEKILKGSQMLGRKGNVMTTLTRMGWCVRVTAEDMVKVYQQALEHGTDDEGKVKCEKLGGLLQAVLAKSE